MAFQQEIRNEANLHQFRSRSRSVEPSKVQLNPIPQNEWYHQQHQENNVERPSIANMHSTRAIFESGNENCKEEGFDSYFLFLVLHQTRPEPQPDYYGAHREQLTIDVNSYPRYDNNVNEIVQFLVKHSTTLEGKI